MAVVDPVGPVRADPLWTDWGGPRSERIAQLRDELASTTIRTDRRDELTREHSRLAQLDQAWAALRHELAQYERKVAAAKAAKDKAAAEQWQGRADSVAEQIRLNEEST